MLVVGAECWLLESQAIVTLGSTVVGQILQVAFLKFGIEGFVTNTESSCINLSKPNNCR